MGDVYRLQWMNPRLMFLPFPHSRLCLRCRDQHVIVPTDDASMDSCRGHLAEDRINVLLGADRG